MSLKLVCSDQDKTFKVTLPIGVHPIGRGELFKVHDKRVSRQHAKVDVKHESVAFTALHRNPLFYMVKGSLEFRTLNLNSTVELKTGDKIGFLPKQYWFEIIMVDNVEQDSELTQPNNSESEINNETQRDSDSNSTVINTSESDKKQDSDSVEKSPGKHVHNDDESQAKKIKVEPIDESNELANGCAANNIKIEPNDSGQGQNQAGCSSTNVDSTSTAIPGMQPHSVRERCYYGSSCYRRNPLHFVQYSHPNDSDWGTGDKGECPYGDQCVKTDPRHWNTHFHPQGISQLPQLQGKIKKKRKRRDDGSSEDSDTQNITTNRLRKRVQHYSSDMGIGSDSNDSGQELDFSESEEDPFGSDDSDDWEP